MCPAEIPDAKSVLFLGTALWFSIGGNRNTLSEMSVRGLGWDGPLPVLMVTDNLISQENIFYTVTI